MKMLALLRPPPGIDVRESLSAHASAELRELWRLYREGWVREMYLGEGPGAVLVLEAESKQAAVEHLRRLPLLAERVMQLELVELRPFQALEMLFA